MNTVRPAREPYPPKTAAEHPHDRNLSVGPAQPPDQLAPSALIAAGDIDVGPGDPPVPIAVWRVARVRHHLRAASADALTPRMAALLVGSYTRPSDTIVSVGEDPALACGAGAGGCTYLSVRDPDTLSGLDHVAGTAALIVLPWAQPRRAGRTSPEDPRRCRRHPVACPAVHVGQFFSRQRRHHG